MSGAGGMQIDAHQHFWQPARGDYDWMPKDDPILARAYAPADLAPDLAAYGIDGTVLVQAAATVAETRYLLGIADTDPKVRAVVGWIDFEDPGDLGTLEMLAKHPKFRGIRPMIQDIPDDDWMLRDDVQWGFRAIADLGLSLDALGFPRHLDNFLTLFIRHSDMLSVVDHCMKPDICGHSATGFATWADGMARLAQETAAFCKLSGLVAEAAPDWRPDDLRPYVDHVLSVFGPERVMWGSDWPVCRLRGEYGDWRMAAETLCAGLNDAGRARVFGGTATEFYRLD